MSDGGNHFKDDTHYTENWVRMLTYALLRVERMKKVVDVEKLTNQEMMHLAQDAAGSYLGMNKMEKSLND